MRSVSSLVAILVLLALVALGFRYAQRRLLFPAPPAPAHAPTPPDGARLERLVTPEGTVEAFLLPARQPRATAAPVLLYAHGNGELVDGWLSEFEPLRARGLSVVLVEYPGYGRSTGVTSESSIRRALESAYDWTASQPEVDANRIIGYGRSLGGGAICALARTRTLAALILESTFTSVANLAAEHFGMPRFVVFDRFDNLGLVRRYASPLLVLHGVRDDSIPVAHARLLAESAPDAELVTLACGHNDCPPPGAAIVEFLARRGLL